MPIQIQKTLFFISFLLFYQIANSQESVAPLQANNKLNNYIAFPKSQIKSLQSLPFFDDFGDNSPFPNPNLWKDKSVYINNHLGKDLISKGCATFDGLDENGVPYDSINQYVQVYGDSLTSEFIDLSGMQSDDSIYLSFYYQPQGNGFMPKNADSLMLFFRRSGGSWTKVWTMFTTSYHDFKAVILPVTDSAFLHNQFQFRFVNRATIGIGNSQWNLDYVLLDKDRHFQDTVINDIAFTSQPENLLNDYTSMPMDHFLVNPSSHLKTNFEIPFRNNGSQSSNIDFYLITKELETNQNIGSQQQSVFFNSNESSRIRFDVPALQNFNPTLPRAPYTFEQVFYATSIYPDEYKGNDTFIAYQHFDNYLSYDDGTAEKAYFLNLFPNAPGQTAVKFSLSMPDTIGGVAIYFPRQVPTGAFKEFALAIYKSIAINGQQDELIYQENFLYPEYQNGFNGFSNYVFSENVTLPEGEFYVSIIQAAGGTSDLLYMGLDVNRTLDNYRYFNVEGDWVASEIEGALMIRPLIGTNISTNITDIDSKKNTINIHPNPAKDYLTFTTDDAQFQEIIYKIVDIQGKIILQGNANIKDQISLESLIPGLYFIHIADQSNKINIQKLLKI